MNGRPSTLTKSIGVLLLAVAACIPCRWLPTTEAWQTACGVYGMLLGTVVLFCWAWWWSA
jgi:hypothetical protein